MPSLKQIKRRIGGVKSTSQITRAMKMVAAAKLKKAQENMERSRPYARKLREVIASIAYHTGVETHPLLAVREPVRIGVVNVTSDRGLCGSFNANICRRTQKALTEFAGKDVQLFTVGRKGYEFFTKRDAKIFKHFPGVFQELQYSQAVSIGNGIAEQYIQGGFDRIYLVYNEFKNAAQQQLVFEQLLPIEPFVEMTAWSPIDFTYEPNPLAVLDSLLPMHVNFQIWQVLQESFASEQGARMTAMDNATENAFEIVDQLTLQYNKARQGAITKELLEIVGGAEGLR